MDDDSECDWTPPIEVGVVESEVFEIPSGLPSLEDFIKDELEKEEIAKSKVDETNEIDETPIETHKEDEQPSIIEVPPEDASIAEEQDEVEEVVNVPSEDDFELPQVEIKKPKVKTKKQTVEIFGIDAIKSDFDRIQKKTQKDDEENLRIKLIESTNNFIENLIGDVVEICEYEDPDDVLRARLDKDKVIEELDDRIFQLDIEQKIRFFLNRKAVEFFRRKKAMRPLIDDSPESIINELRKYREALMMVNRYKGLEESTKQLLDSKIRELKKELAALEVQSKIEAQAFLDIVKKASGADNSEKMETLVENLIRKQQTMEKEISKVRSVLIQRQHLIASLQERARKLEDLGNGLRMMDFEHLQTETQALGKKIEERNNELNRLHSRCNADIHTLAHIREKQHMLRSTISAQQEALTELIEEKQSCREYLNGLKIERGSIRRELKRLSFQNGLLDKPELLLDYDATEEMVNNLQTKINLLKREQLVVDEKLIQMTKMIQHSKRR